MSVSVDLKGRTALVTGASSGLGRHFASLLARSGAAVAVAARRVESLNTVCAEIESAGGTALALPMDVTDPASVRAGVAAAAARFGGIDILVNNAGTAQTKAFLDLDSEDWDRIVDTNLKGCFLVGKEVGAIMRAQGERGGSIVNIASVAGLRVASQIAPYAVSKAGLVHLTKAMALELARHRIRVNALCPGYIETDLNRDFFATDAGQTMIKRVPMRRLGRAEELDGPLLLLCSDASSFMTGSVLAVDGGHLVNTL
ncbi:glucose 1-dehydrogenase [Azospirillum griseum]|uniref:Glucose 1-dehydrogenase n=1 Tax=Azospirillum griseum TaxID=2496639 RepID=A0A3S0JDW7_9PROT|nr:glucose 1-dehydrogenase [Azospirillum griseum]RTR13033.1 glucose 1-dehydrogenase [Azospirillum griseum]